MFGLKKKHKCPRCGQPAKFERWTNNKGRTVEAIWCSNCDADFARYEGEEEWRLIKERVGAKP